MSVGSSASLRELAVVILDNCSPPQNSPTVVRRARMAGLKVAVVDEARQRMTQPRGVRRCHSRPASGQVGIAMARTMMQRYLGALLAGDAGSFGWLLDDDMRVDARASRYCRGFPRFETGDRRSSGPTKAPRRTRLNGLRFTSWTCSTTFTGCGASPADAVLPDRSTENEVLRARYPDYYYDLSRMHTAHLEMPHWLEPAVPSETVREAYSRLLHGAVGLLSGAPHAADHFRHAA